VPFWSLFFQSFWKEDIVMKKYCFGSQRGQGLTEYAVVLSLVAVAAIAATAFFGGAVKSRIAALAGAVAGESQQSISAQNKAALQAAKNAGQAARKVGGMKLEHSGNSVSSGAEIIDDVSLGGDLSGE
jgi:Flp pilus assembly pilin Flp